MTPPFWIMDYFQDMYLKNIKVIIVIHKLCYLFFLKE